jgi:mono/diheme cytochrome c family protein
LQAGDMPPPSVRHKNPAAFDRIGRDLKAWIQAGKPEGLFDVETGTAVSVPSAASLHPRGEIGACLPLAKVAGADAAKDTFFSGLKDLPENLHETDLTTLDAYELAQKGTFAYNVEYPLWADNASKGRWVHVPEGQTIHFDPNSRQFRIPDNSRFYKTFYKPLTLKDGTTRFRRVETRLIVVRTPWEKSLFGTYRWDESEQAAALAQTPYRDGSPWKDNVFELVTDERTGAHRKYSLPARHRCIECHKGSEAGNFILGFTPLQINRRASGEAGAENTVSEEELSQVARLSSYGVINGFASANELPRLEQAGVHAARNSHELRAQGYFVGNCAHCHNPDGFAMRDNGVKLDLRAGQIFDFNTHQRSIHFPSSQERRFVDAQGSLENSYLYFKMSRPAGEQGLFSQMPLHTPGSPDCRGLNLVGKWIRSWQSPDAAENFKVECGPSDDYAWVEQDFTWPESERYLPRRLDWRSSMPEKIRKLRLSPELQKIARKEYAVGYWNAKPSCKFPDLKPEPAQIRPWMLDASGNPKRPYGEVYRSPPGAWFFTTTCAKCHGPQGDGNSTFATALLSWSGGNVRVANLMDGLFGNKGANLKTFNSTFPEDGTPRNLAGNYLLWMTTEGTRVSFPPEAANYLGRHKAQMLNLFREKCMSYITSAQQTTKPIYQDYEIFKDVCFFENRSPDDPLLQFNPDTGSPLHPDELEAWMDRAAFNAGWTIFDYLVSAASGKWWPSNDSCDKEAKMF